MPTATTLIPDARSKAMLWYAAAAAGTIGLAAAPASAQIVYQDIEPDLNVMDTFPGQDFAGLPLDFDNDGDPELVFGERIDANYILFDFDTVGGPDAATAVIGEPVPFGGNNYLYPTPLSNGAIVSSGQNFVTGYSAATFTFGGSDPLMWIGIGDAYMGVQFMLDTGTTHYAWVRCEVPVAGQLIVKDFAYNATPNLPITAGDMGGVAIEPGADGLPGTHNLSAVYPNPFNPQARFTLEVAEQQEVRVEIIDALGQRVATLHDGALSAGTIHAFEIDGSALPSGVYLVRATGERFADTQQVTLMR